MDYSLDYHHARFEKDTRFYLLSSHQDLLGDWVVVRVNGKIGEAIGKIHTVPFPTKQKAYEFYTSECKRRAKRGYVKK